MSILSECLFILSAPTLDGKSKVERIFKGARGCHEKGRITFYREVRLEQEEYTTPLVNLWQVPLQPWPSNPGFQPWNSNPGPPTLASNPGIPTLTLQPCLSNPVKLISGTRHFL